jgi:hypothetical protein
LLKTLITKNKPEFKSIVGTPSKAIQRNSMKVVKRNHEPLFRKTINRPLKFENFYGGDMSIMLVAHVQSKNSFPAIG